MSDEIPAGPAAVGDGTRPPLPAMPAPKRPVLRRSPPVPRATFLPDHPHARHGLRPGPFDPPQPGDST